MKKILKACWEGIKAVGGFLIAIVAVVGTCGIQLIFSAVAIALAILLIYLFIICTPSCCS